MTFSIAHAVLLYNSLNFCYSCLLNIDSFLCYFSGKKCCYTIGRLHCYVFYLRFNATRAPLLLCYKHQKCFVMIGFTVIIYFCFGTKVPFSLIQSWGKLNITKNHKKYEILFSFFHVLTLFKHHFTIKNLFKCRTWLDIMGYI